jgi:hypothetical protein
MKRHPAGLATKGRRPTKKEEYLGSAKGRKKTPPEEEPVFKLLESPGFRIGVHTLLYLLRWRIEKVFDTGKNKLQETKGWATGVVAREIQAHCFALAHNLLILLRRELHLRHGIRELKVEKKHQSSMNRRTQAARKADRSIHPALWKLPAVVQLTAQFIRTLRNGIWSKARWHKVLPHFQASLCAYL